MRAVIHPAVIHPGPCAGKNVRDRGAAAESAQEAIAREAALVGLAAFGRGCAAFHTRRVGDFCIAVLSLADRDAHAVGAHALRADHTPAAGALPGPRHLRAPTQAAGEGGPLPLCIAGGPFPALRVAGRSAHFPSPCTDAFPQGAAHPTSFAPPPARRNPFSWSGSNRPLGPRSAHCPPSPPTN